MNKEHVCVVGLGYVGLPVALLASKKGYRVTGVDLDKEKLKKINGRRDPIGEEYIAKNIKNTKLNVSSDFKSVKTSDIIVICVPTPVKHDYQPDLSPLKSAVKSVAQNLSRGTLLIIESTINPGVCDEVIIPLIEKTSKYKLNEDFWVSHCPERINPGDKKWNVENIPRVAGSSSSEGLKRTIEFYESIIDGSVRPMASLKEAESVKIVENAFRDVNIAFVNELAMSFSKLGVDVKNVIDGAATKPFAFMPHYPSIGVGGHCIPVDPYYLIKYAKGYGFDHKFLSLAREINNGMPAFTVKQLVGGLRRAGLELKGAKVTVLGLSYKPNVADDRESPSYKLIEILKARGAKVTTFDPYFLEKSTAKSIPEAVKGADAIILATSHKQFMKIKLDKRKIKVFVDGKNAFDKAKFSPHEIIYIGIGR